MESMNVVASITAIQEALKVITALQLTAHLWPPHAQVTDGASFDFIVVGAGSAGSVIANRLTEDPNTNVLLIEAGGDPPMESDLPGLILLLKRSRHDWNYTAESDIYTEKCHRNPFVEMSLGKVLGGTGTFNYLMYARGLPRGYKSWVAAAGDDTWNWENVLPYFKKFERVEDPLILNSEEKSLFGTDGNVGISKDHGKSDSTYLGAFKEQGHSIGHLNGHQFLGYSRMMLMITEGIRQGSAHSYLTPIKNRKNLHVLKNTLVTKVLFDDFRNAVGVTAVTEDGNTVTFKATKEVIVSAGAFNTPKLLMLSGIGPKEHLTSKKINVVADLPVGENLIDYVSVLVPFNMEKMLKPLPPKNPHEYPPNGITGLVALNKTQEYPDYQVLNFIVDPKTALGFYSFFFRYDYDICANVYRSGVSRWQIHNQIINLNPKSRGKVLLRSSDPSDPPKILADYFSKEEDLENLVDYIEDYVQILNSTYFRSIGAESPNILSKKCPDFAYGSREYWRCYAMCMMTGTSNYMGTCAMGAVVDGRLRVRGVRRLRVVDASVIPTPNGGNPYGQILMIAEKAADLIKIDHSL